jgi:hypothetical protein
MRMLRNFGSNMKNFAGRLRRTMDNIEKGVSAADKATGGALRAFASTATGGASEAALAGYNANKRIVRSALDTTQRVGRITERAGKQGLVGSGAWTEVKRHAGARGRDYMNQAEGLAQANPRIYQSMQKPNFMVNRR